MTREEAKHRLLDIERCTPIHTREDVRDFEALEMAIKALEQEPLTEEDYIELHDRFGDYVEFVVRDMISGKGERWTKKDDNNPQEPKTGHCKDCKYFEYDSVAKVDGIPLIVAHEICSKWGDGCKTKEDGYCFLFEPQERSEE